MFSAANSSFHGLLHGKKKVKDSLSCAKSSKYQQGYFRALSSTVLESLNTMLDSACFHKLALLGRSPFSDNAVPSGGKAQHLPHVPTCTLRGVMEGTTPEALEMISHLLTKQNGSALRFTGSRV
jgi:hypothetical protein